MVKRKCFFIIKSKVINVNISAKKIYAAQQYHYDVKAMEGAAKNGNRKLIQQQPEQILLTYLLALSVDDKASFQARADDKKALIDLQTYIESQKKILKDLSYTAHLMLALDRMKSP